jgi:hypothetical protein
LVLEAFWPARLRSLVLVVDNARVVELTAEPGARLASHRDLNRLFAVIKRDSCNAK